MQPRKWGIKAKLVMPGLVPGIHVLIAAAARKTWMAGSPSAKTRGACHRAALCADPLALLPGHDEKRLIFKRLERPRKCWVHFGSYSDTRGENSGRCGSLAIQWDEAFTAVTRASRGLARLPEVLRPGR